MTESIDPTIAEMIKLHIENLVEKLESEGHQFEADTIRSNMAGLGVELHTIPQPEKPEPPLTYPGAPTYPGATTMPRGE